MFEFSSKENNIIMNRVADIFNATYLDINIDKKIMNFTHYPSIITYCDVYVDETSKRTELNNQLGNFGYFCRYRIKNIDNVVCLCITLWGPDTNASRGGSGEFSFELCDPKCFSNLERLVYKRLGLNDG